MGFKIETIQVDNGPEFVNDDDKTEKDSAFEKAVKKLNMEFKKKVARHEKKYNSTAKTVLDFKSPDQVVAEYFSKCNKCLDS